MVKSEAEEVKSFELNHPDPSKQHASHRFLIRCQPKADKLEFTIFSRSTSTDGFFTIITPLVEKMVCRPYRHWIPINKNEIFSLASLGQSWDEFSCSRFAIAKKDIKHDLKFKMNMTILFEF